MKQIFTILVALLITTNLWAQRFQYGELYYNITSNTTVEVTYQDWSSSNYVGLSTATIPETVTYEGTTYSVTSIGDYAFEKCSSLTSVTIPNSVTSIGKRAFYWCFSLTTVTIPNSVTSIGDEAFYDCSSLTSITIPNSVTSIGKRAFWECSNLTSVTIPNSVTSIGDGAFSFCWSLTSITIPNSVTSIGDEAFYDCSSLTSVTIPNSVTSIGKRAFGGCSSLTSITIPNSVTSIGDGAFNSCDDLISIVVESGNSNYDSRENCNAIIETATNTLIAGCPNTTIPNSVTSIGDWAFVGCTSLTSVTIPNSVTSIGDSAFEGCSALTSITIPNSVTSIGDGAFYWCYSLTSIVVESGNSTYDSRENCNAIIETATNTLVVGCKNTTIPNSVTSIGVRAFQYCSSLTSITIPNSVTSIGDGAFSDCSSLASVTIPNSVTSIGEYAFAWCSSLTTVICEAIEVPELSDDVFYYMPLSEATLYVPAQSLDDYKAAEQWKEFGTILPIEETSTGVENTYNPSSTADTNKLIRDGQLIIVRDGKSYSVTGQEL